MNARTRAVLISVVVIVAMAAPGAIKAQFFPDEEPTNADITFGCNPGPVESLSHEDPPLPPRRSIAVDLPVSAMTLSVGESAYSRAIAGTGFNLEHAAWSCRAFRRILSPWILEAFEPEVARVDTGQLPLAPEDLSAEELNWSVYQSVMDEPKYRPSWEMLRRLDQQNVRLMLGVWGMPGAFTDDGTRRGRLIPEYVEQYGEYYEAIVDYLVNRQGIRVWSATVMNEPDGGDGTLIDPDLFVEVAAELGPRLARYGVGLYGPDTASASNAIPYVDQLLSEPRAMRYFNTIGTHEYFPENGLADLVDVVRGGGSSLPVYVTEYTSFMFGAMDRGQEASYEMGHTVESLNTFFSLMNSGADAALYWDAVDYYQAGHAAITRWGLLEGPDSGFQPRKRYYAFRQVLPYLQAGARVAPTRLTGGDTASALAVFNRDETADDIMIALVNRAGPITLQVEFEGTPPQSLDVYVTDDDRNDERIGRVLVRGSVASVYVPAESVVTLVTGPPLLKV
jgi:O-glycosyl hydrolase